MALSSPLEVEEGRRTKIWTKLRNLVIPLQEEDSIYFGESALKQQKGFVRQVDDQETVKFGFSRAHDRSRTVEINETIPTFNPKVDNTLATVDT